MIRILLILAVLIAGVALIRSFSRSRGLSLPPPDDDDPSNFSDALEPLYDGSEELVVVVSSPDPIAVEAYRGALHSAGIPTVVFDEAASRMLGSLSTVAMRIMVPVDRLEDARAVIDDFEPGTFSEIDET